MFDNTVLKIIYRPNGPRLQRNLKDCAMRNFMALRLTAQYFSGKIKEDEMGGACGTYVEKVNA